MPRFRYTAYMIDGNRESGVIEAGGELAALERLANLGLTVTDIGNENSASPARASLRAPTFAQQADLAEQMAVLFASGLPASEVTRIIARSSNSPAIRHHFHRMEQLIADGAPFDQSLTEATNLLSPLFAILAGIGQRTGQLGQQMPALAVSLRRQERIGAQIGSALIYPAILLFGGLGVISMMALFLAPRLEVIFTSVGHPVPGVISGFTTLGAILSIWGLPVLAGATVAVLWLSRKLRNPSPSLRQFAQTLPLFGPIMREAALARLTRAIQLLLEAGMPLSLALRSASDSFAADPVARLFAEAAAALEAGNPASSVLAAGPTIPIMLRELFRIGEETNSLPQVLGPAAQRLEDGVERRLNQLMALLTPALTLLIGGVIALIVASVMGAVLSVNDLAF